jgi:hypothetical protein
MASVRSLEELRLVSPSLARRRTGSTAEVVARRQRMALGQGRDSHALKEAELASATQARAEVYLDSVSVVDGEPLASPRWRSLGAAAIAVLAGVATAAVLLG